MAAAVVRSTYCSEACGRVAGSADADSPAANTPMASASADCAGAQLHLRTSYVCQYTQGRAAGVNQYFRPPAPPIPYVMG